MAGCLPQSPDPRISHQEFIYGKGRLPRNRPGWQKPSGERGTAFDKLKSGKALEASATRAKRYRREIQARKDEIALIDDEIAWKQEQVERVHEKLQERHTEADARIEKLIDEWESADEEGKKKIAASQEKFEEFLKRIMEEDYLSHKRRYDALLAEQETLNKDGADRKKELLRKIAQHERWLDVHTKGKVRQRAA